MLAVLVAEGMAKETMEELEVAGAVRYQKMSELVAADARKEILLVLVDEHLGVAEAVSKKLQNAVVESFVPPGDCIDIMGRLERLRVTAESSSGFQDDTEAWSAVPPEPPIRSDKQSKRPVAKRAEQAVTSVREPVRFSREPIPDDEGAEEDKASSPSSGMKHGGQWDENSPSSGMKRGAQWDENSSSSGMKAAPMSSVNASPFTADVEPSDILFRRRTTPLIMLEGPKGGVGRSTIGAHMALYGALKGKRVAIVDLDVNGDISEKFGILQSGDTRGWRGTSVEEAVRDGLCHVHESGVHLIPSPQSREVVLIQPDDALHLVEMCMNDMDVVFVDMPQGWTPLHKVLLPYCSEVVMAVKSAPDSLGRVEEHAEKFVHAQVPVEKVSVVVNQARKKSELQQMRRYLDPYRPKVVVPIDKPLALKGGLNGRKLTLACRGWWDESFGFKRGSNTQASKKGMFHR